MHPEAVGDRRFRRPESVLIVVYTTTHDVLLLERVRPAGFWQSVTGTLEWGESPAAAARRELREETGLSGAGLRAGTPPRRFPILPAWASRYAPGVTENVEYPWYLELDERCEVRLNPEEHTTAQWLPLDTAIARVTSWTNREALACLR